MKTEKENIVNILRELRDRPVEELVTYDLKRDWWREGPTNPWRLMCYYKKDSGPVGDCDVSLRSVVIYRLAFGFEDWRIRPDGRGNFQLEKGGMGYVVRGDTMNSYATTAHAYFRLKGLERIRDGRSWYDAVLEDYDKFAPLYRGAFTDFVRLCHTVGNMLPIPSGELNRARGIGPMKDYFDLYLNWLFEYMATEEIDRLNKNRREKGYLSAGVYAASELFPGIRELIDFLTCYENWDHYVRQNYLEEFG